MRNNCFIARRNRARERERRRRRRRRRQDRGGECALGSRHHLAYWPLISDRFSVFVEHIFRHSNKRSDKENVWQDGTATHTNTKKKRLSGKAYALGWGARKNWIKESTTAVVALALGRSASRPRKTQQCLAWRTLARPPDHRQIESPSFRDRSRARWLAASAALGLGSIFMVIVRRTRCAPR